MSEVTGRRKPEINIVFHWFARLIFRLMGWKVVGVFPNIPKVLITAGPHTANQDGFMMVMASWILRVRLDWMVKKELTRGPVGWVIKAFGGVPIDRSASFNAVDQAVEQFNLRQKMALAVAPEGTRRKLDHWKTGFYWIAVKANVPILVGRIDYARKVVDVSAELIHPTGNIEADIERIWALYRGITAKFPEKVNDMRLRPSQIGERV